MEKTGKKVNMIQLQKLANNHLANKNKIDSPIAKYDSLGRLWCKICSVKVKNELIWPSHIATKSHKEAVAALKSHSQPQVPTTKDYNKKLDIEDMLPPFNPVINTMPKSILKRKIDESCYILPSKIALSTNDSTTSDALSYPAHKRLHQTPPAHHQDASNLEGEGDTSISLPQTVPPSINLPPGFFDVPPTSLQRDRVQNEPDSPQNSDIKRGDDGPKEKPLDPILNSSTWAPQIPKGFFDDPETDAKVRGDKKPQDIFEEEWESFKKLVVQEESNVSETMKEEEDEIMNYNREIEEIDEQIVKWSHIENFHVMKETKSHANNSDPTGTAGNARTTIPRDSDGSEELDDEELALLENDWRIKRV